VEQTFLSAHSEHDSCDHAAEAAGHDDHSACGGHDEHAEEGGLAIDAQTAEEIGLHISRAQGGILSESVLFPAEILLNRDRAAAVSPRYAGEIRQVFAEIGDRVRRGDVLASLENRETLSVYTVKAPLDGVVVAKDASVGEFAAEERVLFEVADLSSVWADISIFPTYQHVVRKGMAVEFIAHDGHAAEGTVHYVSPLVSHETRTFTARCVLEGAAEDFTPGAFVRARIVTTSEPVRVRVERDAVQRLDGEPVVFISDEHGFETRVVQTGRSNDRFVEIISGLNPGERYVSAGAFALKAEMLTSGMDPHAGHGH
jgi:cobalt-zinc-cadmium efflux system membrane fusion protein